LELGAADVADGDSAEPETTTASDYSAPASSSYEDTSDLPREPSSPPPRVSNSGGTLFERMTNLSRGLSRDDGDDGDDDGPSTGLNIPRFLDRQSNN
jgi:cell division protein FtsZ